MRNTTSIAVKELRSYFASPIAYVVTAVFLVITGYFFAFNIVNAQEATIRGFLFPGGFVMLLLAPILTMRLLAEEQKMGTLELLLTAPVRDAEVVLGKYVASILIYLAMIALTLYYPVLLFLFGDPDPGPIASGYLGLFLLGAAFIAVGILASSLSSNQIVAAVIGFGILILLWVINGAGGFLSGPPKAVVDYLALPAHFGDFAAGIIDTKNLIYYLSLTALFLFLAVRSLETRRWR
ncbi:MAG: ABC transporter permease subunit [Chloroflexi bacterium]|nr:ABC transporter permease subunit [Chloroflexota bacterium]